MNIERDEEGDFIFSEVDPPILEMFLAIPSAVDPKGSRAAGERLFPDPVAGKDASVSEEWAEYVRPELREGFENASTTVESDLEPLMKSGELTITLEHVDAWLNTLNQARLVLAARFEVTEADMNREGASSAVNERDAAISQIHVYGLLQECLIQGLEESAL